MLATCTAEGNGLRVHLAGTGLSVLIRRRDFQPEARFSPFYGRSVGPAELAAFLPAWNTLEWKRVPTHALSAAECAAEEGGFYVNLQSEPGRARTHDDLISAFCGFMAGKEFPNAECRTRAIGELETFGHCLVARRECPFTMSLGGGLVCRHPSWRDFAAA